MAQDNENPSVTLRAEIHCTNEQLTELAQGIVNGGKTLAFNQWMGSDVYKSLKDIREFMQVHHFAHVLRGKQGELSMNAVGEDFLLHCLVGHPPAPFVCSLPSPNTENVHKTPPQT